MGYLSQGYFSLAAGSRGGDTILPLLATVVAEATSFKIKETKGGRSTARGAEREDGARLEERRGRTEHGRETTSKLLLL